MPLPSPVEASPRCQGRPTLTVPCLASRGPRCAPLTVEQALAHPGYRPPGGWGEVAEGWAADRDATAWRSEEVGRRLRRDLAEARSEVAEMACELAGEGCSATRINY